MKWPDIGAASATFIPSIRLRKCFTVSLRGRDARRGERVIGLAGRGTHFSCSSPLRLRPSASRTWSAGGMVAKPVTEHALDHLLHRAGRPTCRRRTRRGRQRRRRAGPMSVRAPSDCSRLATVACRSGALARRTPSSSARTAGRGSGWSSVRPRPACWMAWSADHGSSSVMCTRRRVFLTRRSACSEMLRRGRLRDDRDNCLRLENAAFSCVDPKSPTPRRPRAVLASTVVRHGHHALVVALGERSRRPLRPVSSATSFGAARRGTVSSADAHEQVPPVEHALRAGASTADGGSGV